MKVRFEQSGGFAGLIKGCQLDAASLDEEARTGLEELRAQGSSAKPDPGDSRSRDAFQYNITVEEDGNSRTFSFGGGAIPTAIQPLLRELKKHARPE